MILYKPENVYLFQKTESSGFEIRPRLEESDKFNYHKIIRYKKMEAKDESIYDAIHEAVLLRTKNKPADPNIKKMINDLLDKFETEGQI